MSVVAAIDCGTNSTRLLVCVDGEPVERLMRITGLGRGVDGTRRLAPDAVERTLAALRDYREVMDRFGVQRVRMSATSAARDALNAADFVDAAAEVIGVAPEVLSGIEEARLSFRGATTELPVDRGPYLVVDIGGGSTEVVIGPGGGHDPEGAISIDVGCVRMTERFLHSDPPTALELHQAISVTTAYLEDVVREVPATRGARVMVGLAGTVSAAASIEQGLPEYRRERIHHFVLTRAAAEDVFRTVATESARDRAHNPGLEAGRVDTIVGGMCVLVAVMRFFSHETCVVSEADLLDGLAQSLEV